MGGRFVDTKLVVVSVALICAGLFSSTSVNAYGALQLGDGQIDGRKLQPYELTWQQCALQDGQWQSSGSFVEQLEPIGDQVFRHRQINQRPDGGRSVSTSFFDRQSMALLRVEGDLYGPDGQLAAHSEYVFDSDGYKGRKRRGEESKMWLVRSILKCCTVQPWVYRWQPCLRRMNN